MKAIDVDDERVTEETTAVDRQHEHAWRVESGHTTSLGRVLYVRCVDCGARRVDLQEHPQRPPSALSASVPGA